MKYVRRVQEISDDTRVCWCHVKERYSVSILHSFTQLFKQSVYT